MRRIYALRRDRSFDQLADALRQSQLELAEVVSCTFPGRPEPRSARWETPRGAAVLRYEYLPDIELRYLHVLTPDFSLLADGADGTGVELFIEAELGPWFDDWPALRAELHAGEHAPANRAAAAFAVAARAADSSVEGHAALVAAITNAAGRGPVAAAEQIVAVVHADARQTLQDVRDATDDVELRVHLRRALDRIDAKML